MSQNPVGLISILYIFPEIEIEEPCEIILEQTSPEECLITKLKSQIVESLLNLRSPNLVELEPFNYKEECISEDNKQSAGENVILVKFAPFPEWMSSKDILNQNDLLEKTIEKVENLTSFNIYPRSKYAELKIMRQQAIHELLRQVLSLLYSVYLPLTWNEKEKCGEIEWSKFNVENADLAFIVADRNVQADFNIIYGMDGNTKVLTFGPNLTSPYFAFSECQLKREGSEESTRFWITIPETTNVLGVFACFVPDNKLEFVLAALLKKAFQERQVIQPDVLLTRIEQNSIFPVGLYGFRMFNAYQVQHDGEVYHELVKSPLGTKQTIESACGKLLDSGSVQIVLEFCGIENNQVFGLREDDLGWDPYSASPSPYGMKFQVMNLPTGKVKSLQIVLCLDSSCWLEMYWNEFKDQSTWEIINLYVGSYSRRSEQISTIEINLRPLFHSTFAVFGGTVDPPFYYTPKQIESPESKLSAKLDTFSGILTTTAEDTSFWKKLFLENRTWEWRFQGFLYDEDSLENQKSICSQTLFCPYTPTVLRFLESRELQYLFSKFTK
jgi:hypothetical protein